MDTNRTLVAAMSKRIKVLNQEATRLSRLANGAYSDRERRSLREESRQVRRKAEMLEARLKQLIKLSPKQDSISNG